MPEKRPILIAAGGTGGHVYPGLAVAKLLLANDIPVVWMGTRKGLEATVIPAANIPIAWLEVTGLRGKSMKTLLLAPFRLVKALYQSVQIMRRHRPAMVLGMGGFVSGPGGLVAALMGIPVIIHEQNAIAGLTNKLLARFSRHILEGFPNTFKGKKVIATGNPVREDIATSAFPDERLADRAGAMKILIIGGSLGAQALNQAVPAAIAKLDQNTRPEVRHQAGKKHIDATLAQYEQYQVKATVSAFIEDMAEAYRWADLVICRSGALTVAELAAVGIGAILVPYPYAVDDHQTLNGQYLSENGAAILLPQSMLAAEDLAALLRQLDSDRARLRTMAQAARALAKPNATAHVVQICANTAGYELTKMTGADA